MGRRKKGICKQSLSTSVVSTRVPNAAADVYRLAAEKEGKRLGDWVREALEVALVRGKGYEEAAKFIEERFWSVGPSDRVAQMAEPASEAELASPKERDTADHADGGDAETQVRDLPRPLEEGSTACRPEQVTPLVSEVETAPVEGQAKPRVDELVSADVLDTHGATSDPLSRDIDGGICARCARVGRTPAQRVGCPRCQALGRVKVESVAPTTSLPTAQGEKCSKCRREERIYGRVVSECSCGK